MKNINSSYSFITPSTGKLPVTGNSIASLNPVMWDEPALEPDPSYDPEPVIDPVLITANDTTYLDTGLGVQSSDPISTSIDLENDILNAEPLGDVLDDYLLTESSNTDADPVATVPDESSSKKKFIPLLLLLLILCKK